ncbi:hypothetical protein CUD01_21790 [Cellulomonas uda]|uniref:Uncharacterized protein n=1 Tax=Cellulomonas uda TaxID=1714 RepID=A0A4Y3KFB3_CELUD|nr:hypothetical protein CUD01_21790 [Cellulomonas uda]
MSAGVYVGRASTRVRDELWARTVDLIGTGRALMVHTAPTEQGYVVRSHGHHWTSLDIEGVTLMLRPAEQSSDEGSRAAGWSNASRRRHSRK